MLCMQSPPQVGDEFTCCCSRILRNSASTGVSPQEWCHCGRYQRRSIQVLQKTRNTNKKRCNVKSTWDKLHIDYSTDHHPTQLHAANDIDCCVMTNFSLRKSVGKDLETWTNLKQYYVMFVFEFTWTHSRTTWTNSRQKVVKHRDGSPTGGTSRLWLSSSGKSSGTPAQWSMVATNKSIVVFSYPQWLFVRIRSRTIVQEHPKNGRPASWQHWSSNGKRKHSDWKTSSHGSSSDSTRERSEWPSSSSWQSLFSWPWRMGTSPQNTFPRASMTTKITSVCDGRPSFRHFCHLSFVEVFYSDPWTNLPDGPAAHHLISFHQRESRQKALEAISTSSTKGIAIICGRRRPLRGSHR